MMSISLYGATNQTEGSLYSFLKHSEERGGVNLTIVVQEIVSIQSNRTLTPYLPAKRF